MNAITEEEARKKWCPMARSLGRLIGRDRDDELDRTIAFGSQNRGTTMGGALDNCRCIASDCMMWCWSGGCGVGKWPIGKEP